MFNHIVATVPLSASSWEDVIKQLGGKLLEKGYVKESFVQAAIAREIEFPTGLEVPPLGVAMPHTDACHVSDCSVAVALLEQPVKFCKMGGSPDETVDVSVVFMLAVDNPDEQVPAIQKLIGMLQDEKAISKVASSATGVQLEEVIRQYLD